MGRTSRKKRQKNEKEDIDIPVGKTLLGIGLFLMAIVAVLASLGPGGGSAATIDEFGLKVLSGVNECSTAGEVRLEYFYGPRCSACAKTKPGLDQLAGELGEALKLNKHCIEIRDGDRKLCLDEVGLESFQEAASLSRGYAVRATPTLVFDCNRVKVGYTSYGKLREIVCGLGEGIAGC